MKLNARILDIQAGGRLIAILDDETADLLGVHSSDRLKIAYKKQQLIAIVNIASNFPHDQIGLYQDVSNRLGVKNGQQLDTELALPPESLCYVQSKIRGERLRGTEIKTIVKDVVERHLSDIELASFVTALHIRGLNTNEVEALSKAMVETGKTLKLERAPILDKHGIGGLPGDKTSILLVPIIAAAGFTIPKTSSRAITNAAGTADRMESLCPVKFTIEEIEEIVNKTNGCLVWGGSLELAPADDLFIQVGYSLGIDPLLLPSIMSKKKAIGTTDLVVDIPTGRGAKIKTIEDAHSLAYEFVDLGKRLGIKVQCAITLGDQPLGYAIGPALEAREALSAVMGSSSADLEEKATSVSGSLLEMAGVKDGKQKAKYMLKSGRAEKKLREIIEAQGGNPKIRPEDIKVGDRKVAIKSEMDGRVLWIDNNNVIQIAREAGAPKEKGAGILLKVKLDEYVKKGGILFEIYAERSTRLESAFKLAGKLQVLKVSKKLEERMLVDQIPGKTLR